MMRNVQTIDQLDTRFEFNGSDTDSVAASKRVTRTDIDSLATEEALMLVQRLFAVPDTHAPRVVLFADVTHAENSGRMAAAVAETLGKSFARTTCLVDANLRDPALSSLLGFQGAEGLTDALVSDAPVRSFARPMSPSQLWFVPGGSTNANAAPLLASERFRARLQELRHAFDYVIVNAAPLSRFADAVAIGQWTDGLVMTLKAGMTRRETAQVATSNLRAAKVPILGAVLMDRTFPIPEKLYQKL